MGSAFSSVNHSSGGSKKEANIASGLTKFTSSNGIVADTDIQARLVAYCQKSTGEDEWTEGMVIGIWDPVTHDMWNAFFTKCSDVKRPNN